MKTDWRYKWQEAYEGAEFYRSEQNTVGYWNSAAESGGAVLSGSEHLDLLYTMLTHDELVKNDMTLLDAGCGGGEYVIRFAGVFSKITAADSSPQMIGLCRKKCREKGIDNVTFINSDYMDIANGNRYDIVFSCLNPASYCPDGFEKLLELAEKAVVYLSMDTPENRTEPIYNGTNSVRITERYLDERNIKYRKIPFMYMGRIPFAFLIVYK